MAMYFHQLKILSTSAISHHIPLSAMILVSSCNIHQECVTVMVKANFGRKPILEEFIRFQETSCLISWCSSHDI